MAQDTNKTDIVVLSSDEAAAHYETGISGWVDRCGRFWGEDERMARWAGSTHQKCEEYECDGIIKKGSYCLICSYAKQRNRYNKMPKKLWDEQYPVYSQTLDLWFVSKNEIDEYCDDNDLTYTDFDLVIGEPMYASPISEDIFSDIYSDTVDSLEEIDPVLAGLLKQVNDYIATSTIPLSYIPGKFAVEIETEVLGKSE